MGGALSWFSGTTFFYSILGKQMQAAYKYYLTFKSMLLFVVVLIKENSFLGSLCKQAAAAGIGIVAALEQPSEWFPAFQLPLETGRGGPGVALALQHSFTLRHQSSRRSCRVDKGFGIQPPSFSNFFSSLGMSFFCALKLGRKQTKSV